MDHAEARRLIEEAALEPEGLARLMAGDTAEAVALSGHLAGCDGCTRELDTIRRSVWALWLVAQETPSADLKERMLAYVAALGRPRGETSGAVAVGATPPAVDGVMRPIATPPAGPIVLPALRRRFAFVALAAAAVFAILAGGSFVAADFQGQLDRTQAQAARLHSLYAEIEALIEQPTSRLVALRTGDGVVRGSLIVDTASSRIAVLSDALPAPAAGKEYRCWVEVAGVRQPIGRMWFEDGLAYWSGASQVLAALQPGAGFGVSLEVIGHPASAPPTLYGEL